MSAWQAAALASLATGAACAAVAALVARRLVARTRRRQALELNDCIVQGLARVKWALEARRPEEARDAADHTLAEAQKMVSDLLAPRPAGGAD